MNRTKKQLVRHFGFTAGEFQTYAESDPDLSWDPRDDGHVADLISESLSDSKDMCVGVGRLAPGEYHLKHHHPNGSEFYFFLSGEAVVHVDGEDHEARRGTAVYVPAGCVHAIRNTGTMDVNLIYGFSKPEFERVGLVYDE